MRRTRTQVQTTTWLAHPIHGQLADTLHWMVPEHLGMPTPRFSNTGDEKAGGFSPVRVHDLYLHKSDQTVSPAENPGVLGHFSEAILVVVGKTKK